MAVSSTQKAQAIINALKVYGVDLSDSQDQALINRITDLYDKRHSTDAVVANEVVKHVSSVKKALNKLIKDFKLGDANHNNYVSPGEKKAFLAEVISKVKDAAENAATQPLDNQAPTVSVDVTAKSIQENSPIATTLFTATKADADGTTPTFALTGNDAALFTIDAAGQVTFKASPDFETPKSADGTNIYKFNVVAVDAVDPTLTSAQAVTVTVTDVKENFTSGSDAIVGSDGDDTFLVTNTNLGAGDVVDGKGGADTLRVFVDNNAGPFPINISGFETKSVETIDFTSDGFAASASIDLSGATGVEILRDINSSKDVAFNRVTSAANLEIINLTGAADVTVQYQDAVLAGDTAIGVKVNGPAVGTIRLGGVSDANGGVETVNLQVDGATTIGRLDTDLKTLNVAGNTGNNLTITADLNASTTKVDAGTFGGNLTVGLSASGNNVTLIGGSGNDTFDAAKNTGNITATLNGGNDLLRLGNNLLSTPVFTGDNINGGDGTDTIEVWGSAIATNDGTLQGVEIVTLTAATSLDLRGQTEGFTINLSSGVDVVSSGSGNDTIVGGNNVTSADFISGDGGNDTLSVSGNTTLSNDFRLGNTTLFGTGDIENIRYDNTGGAISVDLTGQTEGFNVTLSAGNFNDTFTHNSGAFGHVADNVTGNAGNNTFNIGSNVNNTIVGAGGSDTLNLENGGRATVTTVETINLAGSSVVSVTPGDTTDVTVNDNAGFDSDVITLQGGNDTVNLGGGFDTVNLGEGANRVVIAAGDLNGGVVVNTRDNISGGSGIDTLAIKTGGNLSDGQLTGVSSVETLELQGNANATVGTNAKATGITAINGATAPGAGVADNTVNVVQQADAWTLAINGGEDYVDANGNNVDDRNGLFNNDNDTVNVVAGAPGSTGTLTLNVTNVEKVDASAAASGVVVNVTAPAIQYDSDVGPGVVVATRYQGANVTGSAFADSINGGKGDDVILGGAGKDALAGGEGNDTYVLTVSEFNADQDTITEVAGQGNDTVRLTSTNADESIVDAGFNGRFVGQSVENLDLISTGPGGTTYHLGKDVGGNPVGGLGNYLSQTGINTITANSGVTLDLLLNSQLASALTVNGSNGADKVDASAINVALTYNDLGGGALGDSIKGGSAGDTINLNDGINSVQTNGGNDTVRLGSGIDTVDTGSGDDTINAGANVTDADVLVGGIGNDILNIASTDGATKVLSAANQISGIETINLASEGTGLFNQGYKYDITVDNDNAPTTGTLTVNGSTLLRDASSFIFGDQAETLKFDARAVTNFKVNVTGGAAGDRIAGGSLADTLKGGEGADKLYGSFGNDSIDLSEAVAVRDQVGISAGNGADVITGFNTTAAAAGNQDQLVLVGPAGLITGAYTGVIQAVQGADLSLANVVNITTAVAGGVDTAVKAATFLQTSNLGDIDSVSNVQKVIVLNDGVDSYVWAYNNDNNANVNASEFTLLAKLDGVTGAVGNRVEDHNITVVGTPDLFLA